ncbi:hypothetical protein IOQ27_005048, partial [Salmonella enterica]|nr:hypothetical protein [Salmonella enterica]
IQERGVPNGWVFPAPAGINRMMSALPVCHNSVPRASGDKPGVTAMMQIISQCSPRQRG